MIYLLACMTCCWISGFLMGVVCLDWALDYYYMRREPWDTNTTSPSNA